MEYPHEMQLNKPDPFNPNKNKTSVDWRLWKKNFLIYLELTEARLKLSERGLALFLLNLIGPVGIEAKENMTFNDVSEEENMEILLKKFDEIFDPPLNEMEERYKFFSRRKYDAETIENYVTCLKEQAAKCNFDKQTEKFVLDMFVLNMDYSLQQYIFLTKDLSLSVAVKLYEEHLIEEEKMRNICDTKFDTLLHTDDLTDTKKANDNFLQNINEQENKAKNIKDRVNIKENANENNYFQARVKVCGKCFETGHYSEECNKVQNDLDRQQSSKYSFNQNQNELKAANVCSKCGSLHQFNAPCNEYPARNKQNNTKNVCFRCNTQHPPKQCPAYNVTCSNCHKLGHFDHACKSKKIHESFSKCPRCNITSLKHYNDYYNYCKLCKICILKDEFLHDFDSFAAEETESQQPRRRRRRHHRSKQSQNEESCCIS